MLDLSYRLSIGWRYLIYPGYGLGIKGMLPPKKASQIAEFGGIFTRNFPCGVKLSRVLGSSALNRLEHVCFKKP
jgi:hypothetical protein